MLALDADAGQTRGAQSRGARAAPRTPPAPDQPAQSTEEDGRRGTLEHATVRITPETMVRAVDGWVADMRSEEGGGPGDRADASGPTPVLLVALHACGSLTPDVLRGLLRAISSNAGAPVRQWTPAAAVVVGCCYNLMSPTSTLPPLPIPTRAHEPAADFPLSKHLKKGKAPELTQVHLQLAAQVPREWTRTEEARAAARLARRKVVWRALLAGVLDRERVAPAEPGREGEGEGEGRAKRLRRLNDSAYESWEGFVAVARERMGVPERADAEVDGEFTPTGRTARRLEVFHVLRCLLGPVIEVRYRTATCVAPSLGGDGRA